MTDEQNNSIDILSKRIAELTVENAKLRRLNEALYASIHSVEQAVASGRNAWAGGQWIGQRTEG